MGAVAGRLFFPRRRGNGCVLQLGLTPPGEGITNSFLERYEVLIDMVARGLQKFFDLPAQQVNPVLGSPDE